jgi:hypothetical protein
VRVRPVRLANNGPTTSYDGILPYTCITTINMTINRLNVKILQFYKTGFGLYGILLQSMGSKKMIYTTLMRLAFKWVLL